MLQIDPGKLDDLRKSIIAVSINTGTSFECFQKMSLFALYDFMKDYVEVLKKNGWK